MMYKYQEVEEREGIEGYVFDKMDDFLKYQMPHGLMVQYAVVELGLIYDELLIDSEEPAEKPDPSLTKEEAITQAKALFDTHKPAYYAVFDDFCPSKEKKELVEKSVLDFINGRDQPYFSYI